MVDLEKLADELYEEKKEALIEIELDELVDDSALMEWCVEKIQNDYIAELERRADERREDAIIQARSNFSKEN